jgi:hypothetical protein
MKAEVLIGALRELQGRGWPCYEDGDFFELIFAAVSGVTDRQVVDVSEDGLGISDTWIVIGFLVSQLETRGLRRDVDYTDYTDGSVVWRVHIYPEWEPECLTFRAETELEALINACLALPTGATP